ncbi:MAG: alpha/beta hydrolase [Desulfatiglans sp.]|jgi:acetyl esterase/lipase|nr:alpha/beta hydrolase [Desulfatiglans sp.]
MSINQTKGPDEIKTYKEKNGKELKAHIFYPNKGGDKTETSPAFLFFHPGGWTMGEPQWGYEICSHYASKGLTAISFQYRITSIGGSTPADALADVKSAIRWTRKNGAELGIDPGKVIAGAISAGSHLATCAACIEGFDDTEDDLNLSPVPDAFVFQSACLNTVIIDEFTSLLQGRASSEELSPFHHIKAGMPPMCIIHGKADNLVPFGSISEYVKKSVSMGNRCELHPFEDTDHFFGNVDSTEVFSLMDEFLMSLGYL